MPARIGFITLLSVILSSVFLPLVHAQTPPIQKNVTVSATVPADPEDFQVHLEIKTPGSTFSQDSELTYELTYGSNIDSSVELRVEANWSTGELPNGSVPILDYVVGSASNAYAGTEPVVDILNRKIAWTITNFPAQTTDQTVTFKLRTNSNYTGSDPVIFRVHGLVSTLDSQSATSTITKIYQYRSSPVPTQTPAPTLSPAPATPAISSVGISSVSYDNAEVIVDLSAPGTMSLAYGTDPRRLSQTISSLSLLRRHRIRLPDLKENTQYYFRVTASIDGQTIRSGLFTFITGKNLPSPKVHDPSVILVSDDVILHNSADTPEAIIPIPRNKTYNVSFKLEERNLLKDIAIEVRDLSVLGINTFSSGEPSMYESRVLEIKPSTFVVHLKTPDRSSTYEVIARISDRNGNLSENRLITLHVNLPLQIIDSQTKQGVENARVLFSKWNEVTQTYDRISPNVYPISNPLFSEPSGDVDVVLPPGKYKADVSTIGYESKNHEFVLVGGEERPYPAIELTSQPFSLVAGASYYGTLVYDVWNRFVFFARDIATSFRFFKFIAYGSTTLFIILTLLSLSQRISIPVHHLPRYYHNRIKMLTKKRGEFDMTGTVTDAESDKSLDDTHVALIEGRSGKVFLETSTNPHGMFHFAHIPESFHGTLVFTKNGYYASHFSFSFSSTHGHRLFALTRSRIHHIRERIWHFSQEVLSRIFSMLLFLTLFAALLLGIFYGPRDALPFVIISLLNFMLWFFYHYRRTAPIV